MSKDIVQRLRDGLPCFGDECKTRDGRSCMCAEAADRIEALEAEVARLNDVLAYTDFGECWTCKKALKFKDAYRCFDCDFVYCKACCQPHITEMADKVRAAEAQASRMREALITLSTDTNISKEERQYHARKALEQ